MILSLIFVHSTLVAQEQEFASLMQPTASLQRGSLSDSISLDFRSIEVTDALKFLAMKSGMNIVISRLVSGRVSLLLTDVPIEDVFYIILRSNNLAFDRQGEIFNIMTEEEYQALYGKRFSDQREVKMLRLKYALPEQAFNLLDTIKSDIGRILVDQDSGTVMIMDTPKKIEEMTQALSMLEHGYTIRIFDLQYAKAKDVEEHLKSELDDKEVGTIRADERSNQVVVRTLANRMKDVERIIKALDQKTREVLIEARIVSVTLSDDFDVGINWSTFITGKDDFADWQFDVTLPIDTSSGSPPATHFGRLQIGTTRMDDFAITLQALETIGETKILANPRLSVISGQEARVHVGTREAYVTTTTTTGQTTTTTAESVTFIDVGIQMSVTPTINNDGFIEMKVKPEVSNVVKTLTTPSNNEIPIVDTSVAETTVVVKDGTTIIIGGLRKDEKKHENRQLPFLHRLPLIGPAFKQRNQDNERKELLVLITPHIVSGEVLMTGTDYERIPLKEYHPYER